jgi:hypothetical protein
MPSPVDVSERWYNIDHRTDSPEIHHISEEDPAAVSIGHGALSRDVGKPPGGGALDQALGIFRGYVAVPGDDKTKTQYEKQETNDSGARPAGDVASARHVNFQLRRKIDELVCRSPSRAARQTGSKEEKERMLATSRNARIPTRRRHGMAGP